MPRKTRKPAKRHRRRVVVDTSVLVAGISGFRRHYVGGWNPSADLLHDWAEKDDFRWLYSEEILDEYKEVLRRLHVRPSVIGRIINLIRERADAIEVRYAFQISPDPKDDSFCLCAETGNAELIFTLNVRDFPQDRLCAKVVRPGG